MGLYNGYFGEGFALDPSGLAVKTSFSDCSKEQVASLTTHVEMLYEGLKIKKEDIIKTTWLDFIKNSHFLTHTNLTKEQMIIVFKNWKIYKATFLRGITSVIEKMESGISLECECCESGYYCMCDKQTSAYVYGDISNIHLCPKYWREGKTMDASTQLNTLLHEISHQSGYDTSDYDFSLIKVDYLINQVMILVIMTLAL